MPDSDWMPADKREHADTCQVVLLPEQNLPCRCLVAHAAEADRRIAERDELIRELTQMIERMADEESWTCGPYAIEMMDKIKAYQKEQA